MNIEVTLKPTDDRIVRLQVTDQHGETYIVGLEFCAHDFGPKVDDVQKDDDVQNDLEAQLETASNNTDDAKTDVEEKTSKNDEGIVPDLGTAKDQLNEEDGVEIL